LPVAVVVAVKILVAAVVLVALRLPMDFPLPEVLL
jgi:hypothetical protein